MAGVKLVGLLFVLFSVVSCSACRIESRSSPSFDYAALGALARENWPMLSADLFSHKVNITT